MRVAAYIAAGLVAIIVVLVATLWIAGLTLEGRIARNIAALAAADTARQANPEPGDLPAPVARFRAASVKAGQPPVRGVSMAISGRLLLPGQTEWHDIEGRQYVSALRPAFLWNVRLAAGPAWVEIADHYQDCTGSITSRAFSLYPLLSERDVEELTITQLSRWSGLAVLTGNGLSDPPHVVWEAVDDRTAMAEVTDCGRTIRHRFHFDAAGRVIHSESADRYELYPGVGYVATGSVMHRLEYRTIDGLALPTRSRIIRIENETREVEFLTETFTDFHVYR